jgi:cbb3-type cytochrome oxidase subunit 3
MIHDLLSAVTHSMWSDIMLVVLVIVFGGIVYWTFSGGRHRFDRESRLPLDDHENTLLSSDSRRTQP